MYLVSDPLYFEVKWLNVASTVRIKLRKQRITRLPFLLEKAPLEKPLFPKKRLPFHYLESEKRLGESAPIRDGS